jgi:uncharacterized damage-inducible protein DinB
MQTEDAQAPIGQAKALTQMVAARMRSALRATPDDKLQWSPSDTARNTLHIVGHICAANKAIAATLRGEPMPAMTLSEIPHSEIPLKDRSEAESELEAGVSALLAALDEMTADRLASQVATPFGMMPMTTLITIPGYHMMGHLGQVDYLQTIWGDWEMHG